MRDRLIEIIKNTRYTAFPNSQTDYNLADQFTNFALDCIVDKLLANGVIAPPYKMGDTVYRIVEMSTGITSKIRAIRKAAKITGIIQPCEPTIKRFIRCVTVTKNNIIDCCENYGKTVFLTKEEAEQALKGGDK